MSRVRPRTTAVTVPTTTQTRNTSRLSSGENRARFRYGTKKKRDFINLLSKSLPVAVILFILSY